MRTSCLAALGAVAAQLVAAHYTFPDLIEADGTVSADWQYVRMTDNHYSNGPVTDVTSSQMKCYESTTASTTSTYTVSAGATVGFKADNTMGHPGYFDAYLSLATPTANTESAGSGNTWFKIWDWAPTYSPSTGLVFASEGITQVTFKIPSETPSGQYLLRIEQIALHLSGTVGGAQLYIACAQLNIINGGNGTPGPFASFPGTYSATDPGILINIYSLPAGFTGYTPPGPPVWPPVSGSTTTTKAATTTTTKAATTTTTTKAATTTTTKAGTTTTTKASTTTVGGPSQTHYGQCGGQGYTGPTVCASPYTCQASSIYYSQCL